MNLLQDQTKGTLHKMTNATFRWQGSNEFVDRYKLKQDKGNLTSQAQIKIREIV
jgi:hypothetical protein